METIKEFRDEYAFLSNYYPCKVEYNGITYDSAEAAYHAQKSPGHEKDYIGMSADDSKHYSRTLPLRQDWENVKVPIMMDIVKAKFTQNTRLKRLLLETGDAELQEGNWWWDTFWGIYNGEGKNILGKILMTIRDEFRGVYNG